MILIKTERLLIRHANKSDAEFFLRLMNSPNWLKHIGNRNINTKLEAQKYIDNSIVDDYERLGYGLYIMDLIKERKPIGICGFVQRDYLDHPDIGFAILPEYERKGLTYEAAKAVLTYGKTKLQLKIILAITTKNNTKTINLLRKLNMKMQRCITPSDSKQQFIVFEPETISID